MFRKPITVQYPEQRVVLPLRFRGRLVMPIDPEKGTNRCTACMRCVKICPNHSIDIEKATGPDGAPLAEAGEIPVQPRHVHVLQPLRGDVPVLRPGDVRRARAGHDGQVAVSCIDLVAEKHRPAGKKACVVAEEVPRHRGGGVERWRKRSCSMPWQPFSCSAQASW